jgi:ankyrin repeat protein
MQGIFGAARFGEPEKIRRLIDEGADPNAVYVISDDTQIRQNNGQLFPRSFLPPSGWTLLMFAAAFNGPEAVQVLLDAGADIDARCPWGFTAFMHAVIRNPNVEVLRTLWNTGDIDIDAESSKARYNVLGSNTLGLAAVYSSNPEVLAFLIECGASIDQPDQRGHRPLMLAAQYNTNPAVLRYLLDSGAKVTDNLLSWALKMNPKLEIVSMLLDAGCKVGEYAVENAIEGGADISVFQRLFEAGMDDRSYGLSEIYSHKYGNVLAFGLEKTNDLELIRFLYEADRPKILTRLFNTVDYFGMRAFPKFLEITEDAGAVDDKGRNLLLFFLRKGGEYPELITEILDAGVDVNARDVEGNTALMYARKFYTLPLLMRRGADPNVRDFNGGTLLQSAVRRPTYLVRRKVSEDIWEHRKVWIGILLEYGANPDGRDLSGKNAWDYAADNPDPRVLAYLKDTADPLRFRPMGEVPEGRPIKPRVLSPEEVAQWAERWLAASKAFKLGDKVRQIVEYGKEEHGSYLIIVAPNGWISVGKTEENFGPYNFSEGNIDRKRFEQGFWGLKSGVGEEEGRVVYENFDADIPR